MSIYLEPILDPNTNEYVNVLTATGVPEGPLGNQTKTIRAKDLSEFKPRISTSSCKNVIMNTDGTYMTTPQLFSFMRINGYIIDIGLTNLYKSSTPNCVCVYFYEPTPITPH
jgi:hypothetical protein